MLPADPHILLSVVNTALRDEYESLEEFCAARDESAEQLTERLSAIGFHYDSEQNRFV